MKTITKKIVKSILDRMIEKEGMVSNLKVKDILRNAGYFANQGMVSGFNNQIFNENLNRYERGYNGEFIVYSFKNKTFECWEKGQNTRRRIDAVTSGKAKSKFLAVTGGTYINVRTQRV